MRYKLLAGLMVILQCAKTLITQEPYDRMGHVRICGGRGWRQPLLPGSCSLTLSSFAAATSVSLKLTLLRLFGLDSEDCLIVTLVLRC